MSSLLCRGGLGVWGTAPLFFGLFLARQRRASYHAAMMYDLLMQQLRKHFYLVFHERYENEGAHNHVIERHGGKHPLLRPELIVVNDQVHGFKRVNKRYSSLENFPIFVEIEYIVDEGEKFVEFIDLHAEALIKFKNRIKDLTYLANVYHRTIVVENIQTLTSPVEESLVIYSRLNEVLTEMEVSQNEESGEPEMSESEFSMIVETYLVSFVNFLKAVDDVVVKGKKINKLDQIQQSPSL